MGEFPSIPSAGKGCGSSFSYPNSQEASKESVFCNSCPHTNPRAVHVKKVPFQISEYASDVFLLVKHRSRFGPSTFSEEF